MEKLQKVLKESKLNERIRPVTGAYVVALTEDDFKNKAVWNDLVDSAKLQSNEYDVAISVKVTSVAS